MQIILKRTILLCFWNLLQSNIILSKPQNRIIFPDDPEYSLLIKTSCPGGRCNGTSNNQQNRCPNSKELINLRTFGSDKCDPLIGEYYWTETRTCYVLLEQGPCNAGEWLVIDHSENLVCKLRNGCNGVNNDCISTRTIQLKCPPSMISIMNEYGEFECDCITGEIYHPETNLCYLSHSKGPCNNGFTIRVKDEFGLGYGSCMANQCPHNTIPLNPECYPTTEQILFKSNCYEMDTQGPCNIGSTIQVRNSLSEPLCIFTQSVIRPSFCSRGSRRDFGGRCRKIRKSLSTRPNEEDIRRPSTKFPLNETTRTCPKDSIYLLGKCFGISH